MPLMRGVGTLRGEGMLRHISWRGVIAGTVVALLAGRLILVTMPDFYGMIAYEDSPGDMVVLSVERQMTAAYVQMLVSAISWSLAYFLGGMVAGRMARSSGGLNGVLTAVLGALVGVAQFAWGVLPLVVDASIDSLSRSENLGTFSFVVMVFAVFLPISVLVAYIGGRLGGRLRARASARAGA
jgi:hypothetical protein